MNPAAQSITDAELDVLKVLWALGPATVRQVHGRLGRRRKRWAYTTVLTLLYRLREKGFVRSEKQGAALVFQATGSREALLRQQLLDLADRVCDGTATPLVHALVSSHRFTAEEISELRQMIEQLDRGEPPQPSKRGRCS
jgi:predicted transcriptional regulator